MKRTLFSFGIRLAIIVVLSIMIGIAAVLPLPKKVLPVVALFFYPVAWFWNALGRNELLFIPPNASLVEAVYIVVRMALPFYLLVSYIPPLARWSWRRTYQVTRHCLELPSAFSAYFIAGGFIGTLVGLLIWGGAGCAGSTLGLVLIAGGAAGLCGWCAAVLRCSIALSPRWGTSRNR